MATFNKSILLNDGNKIPLVCSISGGWFDSVAEIWLERREIEKESSTWESDSFLNRLRTEPVQAGRKERLPLSRSIGLWWTASKKPLP